MREIEGGRERERERERGREIGKRESGRGRVVERGTGKVEEK